MDGVSVFRVNALECIQVEFVVEPVNERADKIAFGVKKTNRRRWCIDESLMLGDSAIWRPEFVSERQKYITTRITAEISASRCRLKRRQINCCWEAI